MRRDTVPPPVDANQWRETIWTITSIFETGRPKGNPAAYRTDRAGTISYGKHGATLASGALYAVLSEYFRRSRSPISQKLQQKYAPRVRRRDPSLKDDRSFKELLILASTESAMQAAQDEVFDRNFYQPAVQRALAYNVRSPLGLATIYDAGLHDEVDTILRQVTSRLGGKAGEIGADGRVIDERKWLASFLDEREGWLRSTADRLEKEGRRPEADDLRRSIGRVDELRLLLQGDKLQLQGRFNVGAHSVKGIDQGGEVQVALEEDGSDGRIAVVRNKIGLHASSGGGRWGLNSSELAEWMQALTSAGIPLFLAAADNYDAIDKAVQLIRQTQVPHTLVYRVGAARGNVDLSYDAPDYDLTPALAAARHWERILTYLPPAFDRQHVWLEPVNEVDRRQADWLGRFAVRIASLAMRQGYKVTLFGWREREPGQEDWETPGMLDYLRLCAEHPEQLAVSLHEYSDDAEEITGGYPDHIGRFRLLFRACDRHGIPRPTVHVTEWGWATRLTPEPQQVMEAIRWANLVYGAHPQIRGAAFRCLEIGEGQGTSQSLPQLIKSLTQLTVETTFKVRLPSSAAVGMPTSGEQRSSARCVLDVNYSDDTQEPAGTTFIKKWRVENNGQTTWRPGFKLVHIPRQVRNSRQMAAKAVYELAEVASRPTVAPGEQVEISLPLAVPQEPSDAPYFSDWRLHDEMGTFFGDTLQARIRVANGARQTFRAGAASRRGGRRNGH